MTPDDVVDLVTPLAGLRWPDWRYQDLLMPADLEPAANRLALAGQSSCALLARAAWRLLGCAHPILTRPYRVGRAVSDVVEIARDAGAWHDATDPGRPEVGDVVLVGEDGHEHVYLVTALYGLPGEGWRVHSVDGGQGYRGAGILARTRTWPSWADRWWDVVDPEPLAPALTRPVRGWAETARVVGYSAA